MSAQTAWGDLPENAPIVATPAPAAPVAEPVVSTETAATAESEAAEVAKEEEGVETGLPVVVCLKFSSPCFPPPAPSLMCS